MEGQSLMSDVLMKSQSNNSRLISSEDMSRSTNSEAVPRLVILEDTLPRLLEVLVYPKGDAIAR